MGQAIHKNNEECWVHHEKFATAPFKSARNPLIFARMETLIPITLNAATPDGGDDGMERGVAVKTRAKTKKPSMYRVILMNDDYTPMEFVVSILMGIFKKTSEEATRIMLNVHQTGIGTCGVYTFEIAETKVAQVMDAAKRNQHPLQCTLEKV